MRKLTVL